MLKCEKFKKVTDTYEDIAEDKLLKGFVEIAKQHMRNPDMLIRYGAEEFIFIFPAVTYEIEKRF